MPLGWEMSQKKTEIPGTGELRTMVFDGRMLTVASLVNSALGAVYWFIAARFFPAQDVGIASTTVNSALTLATVSNLALGPVVERLVPVAGRLQLKMVTLVQAVTGCLAVVLALAFLWLGPSDQLFPGNGQKIVFVLAVPVLARYSLQDSVLIGLRTGKLSALRNIAHAVAKLVIIAALATSPASTGIVLSWIIPSLVGVVVVQCALFATGGLLRRERDLPPRLPPARRIISFNLLATVWMVVQALPGLAVPVIVLRGTSEETAAYFNLSWTVVTASTVLVTAVAGPYVSSASRNPDQLGPLTRRFILMYLRISVLRTVMVALGGPVLMWFYGADYARGSLALLLLIALGQAVSTSAYIYGNLERVNGRIGCSALLQGVGAVVLTGAAALLVPAHGLVGAGLAYLVHDIYLAVASAPRATRLIRSMRRGVLPDDRLRAQDTHRPIPR